MSRVTAVLLLAFATNAYAFRGRPASDLRFARHTPVLDTLVASDYTNFLLLSTSSVPEYGVFTQKIVGGVPVGPHLQLGFGKPEHLSWMGTEYLAAWNDGKSLRVATVSRDGSPLSVPDAPVVQGDRTFLGVNGSTALAFAYTGSTIAVQRLDVHGRAVGASQTYAAPELQGAVVAGPAANGAIGVAISNPVGVWLMLFRADGSTITSAPIAIADAGYGPVVATNGRDTAVLFHTPANDVGAQQLKTALVGSDGSVKSLRVTHTMANAKDKITLAALIWDGGQFLALMNVIADAWEEGDAALLRISRDGSGIGGLSWITQESGKQTATALAWSGRELLVPLHDLGKWPDYDSFCIPIDAATLTPGPRARLGLSLTKQVRLTIEAGAGGYLAAWFESDDEHTTLRASRIDAEGNYLDGAGIVLETTPLMKGYAPGWIAIDGHGPEWFVVWTNNARMRGRTVSRGGKPGAATIGIGSDSDVAVRWDGTQYVVLSAHESLHRTNVSASGVVGETVTLAEYEEEGRKWVDYDRPALVKLGARLLAVYDKVFGECEAGTPNCWSEHTITGLLLDDPEAAPFVIAEQDVFQRSNVAASETQALVTWTGYGLNGVFVDANAVVGAPFLIDADGSSSAVASNGSDFFGVWSYQGNDRLQQGKVELARIAPGGTIDSLGEFTSSNIRLDLPVLAASSTLRPLAGFTATLVPNDYVRRAVLGFVEDWNADAVPPAPSILCATRNEDETITVRWQHSGDALGMAIELQLSDGTFREIGVAAADATIATVSTAGLTGSAVRVRAWNAAGASIPSDVASSLPAPEADLPSSIAACEGVPFALSATLHGAAPFNIRWSDGVVQTDVNAHTVSRTLTLADDATLSIVSVTDASCEAGSASASTRIEVGSTPRIDEQSSVVRVARGEVASLHVASSTGGVTYAWFAGARGDASHPVGANSPTFLTPPAIATAHYWVRLTTPCGKVDSETMEVSLNGRRRAVR